VERAEHRYAEAESLYRRALAIEEKTLGPDHPDLSPTLSNYAVLLRQLHRKPEANELETRLRQLRATADRNNPGRFQVDWHDLQPTSKQ
jgi:hypothetical protein